MRWEELNGAEWTITAERTKNRRTHTIPLSSQALTLLPERRKRENVLGEGENGFQGWSRAKANLDLRSGVDDWRLHDLR
jgi:integrase